MGSSGSGHFSDYSGSQNQPTGDGGYAGGGSGSDRCAQAFNAGLEEVGLCDYFSQTGTVPLQGTRLSIVVQQRILVIDASGVVVGALPTTYNYLAACLQDGFNYIGVVHSSTVSPTPQVIVDFTVV